MLFVSCSLLSPQLTWGTWGMRNGEPVESLVVCSSAAVNGFRVHLTACTQHSGEHSCAPFEIELTGESINR